MSKVSLRDSFDFRGVAVPSKRQIGGWLETVQPQPPAAEESSPKASSRSPTRRVSTSADHTPATSRYAADQTVMGSPIPLVVGDDDSEVVIARGHSSPNKRGGYSSRSPTHRPAAEDISPRRLTPPQPYPYTPNTTLENQQSAMYSSALMQTLSVNEGTAIALSHSTHQSNNNRKGTTTPEGRARDLYSHAMRAKVAKQQWVSMEKARQELLEAAKVQRDCPFTPSVSPFAVGIQRPPELRPENRVSAELMRRKQWVALKKQELVEQELEECTFKPLTLRAAKLEQPAAAIDAASPGGIFRELYEDAEARKLFNAVVQPHVVEQLERNVKHRSVSAPPMPPRKAQEVVERLCARGAVVEVPSSSFKPTLSRGTERIIEQKVQAGERDADVVQALYLAHQEAEIDRQLEAAAERERERAARAAEAAAAEEKRSKLNRERVRNLAMAKFRALAEHISGAEGKQKRPSTARAATVSVVALARTALDLFTPEETEELLGAFEHCGVDKVTEHEFVVIVLRHAAQQADAGHHSALLTLPPPPPRGDRAGSCVSSAAAVDSGRQSNERQPPMRIKREKIDPAELERLRARREAQREQWREDARARENPQPADYKPPPRRLIPYECRPDVRVPVRENRSERLRRAHVSGKMAAAAAASPLSRPAAPGEALYSHGGGEPSTAKDGSASQRTTAAIVPQASSSRGRADSETKKKSPTMNSVPSQQTDQIATGGSDTYGASWLAKAHGRSPPTDAALVLREPSAVRPGGSDDNANKATPTKIKQIRSRDSHSPPPVMQRSSEDRHHTSSSSLSYSDPMVRLYRDVISEHAAYGGEEALSALGRELLLKQIQEYQGRRTK